MGGGIGVAQLVVRHTLAAAPTRAGGVHAPRRARSRSARSTHCVAVKGKTGKLGTGDTTPNPAPMGVSGLDSGIVAVEAGDSHSCALTSAGAVKCWGDNSFGHLGTGDTTPSLMPIDVSGLASVAAIAVKRDGTCALTTAGGVKCWGSSTGFLAPQDIAGLPSGIVEIGVGDESSCALASNGGMLCWGFNDVGQLRDGTILFRSLPTYVTGLTGGNGANQTISFATLPSKTIGDAPFALNATASSGLGVSFTSLTPGVCTVSGTVVTVGSVGLCRIAANQAGNSTFSAALQITRSFAVNGIAQAITGFSPATPIVYGAGLTFVLSATGGTSGNPITFASTTPGICAVAGNTVSVLNSGICVLTANQAGNAGYNAAPQGGVNVVINSLDLAKIINFGALPSKWISDAPFAVSATVSSGLPVTFTSSTPAVCAIAPEPSGRSISRVMGLVAVPKRLLNIPVHV